ncbi:MAG: aminotransferase class I/II-fold pyridoxal phosphate-dependent enzyme [Acidiferrobacter sp.]
MAKSCEHPVSVKTVRAGSEGHRRRVRECREGPPGRMVTVRGTPLLAFISNDYLGLAADPRLSTALIEATRRYGVGSGGSHLLGGHTAAHHELEVVLAEWVGAERALIFSSGYMANLALLTVLSGRHRRVFEDRRNHASLIDAVTLARAHRSRYRDVEDLERQITAHDALQALVVTDGVFSMDGDRARLPEILAIAARSGARVIVDDAHALGVVGPGGRGTLAATGLARTATTVQMATLGKALGVVGAFVAGEAALIETLIQRARPYIYTTALPPALAAATTMAVTIARDEEFRRQQLAARIHEFETGVRRLGLDARGCGGPIQPLVLGGDAEALAASQYLRDCGLLVGAVRPPTVPVGSARLRITLSALHTAADVTRLLEALATLPPGCA